MLVSIVNVALLSRWTLYEEQVTAMVDSPATQATSSSMSFEHPG